MATQDYLQNTGTSTNRVVAFFNDRDKAYQAMSELKQAGIAPDRIGLAVGQDYEASGQQTSSSGGNDTSFWQKVKDFFSGEDHHDESDFGDATGSMGWDEGRSGYYRQGISAGGAVVTVSGDRIDEARTILQRNGGDLRESGFEQGNTIAGSESGTRGQSTGEWSAEGERRIQLRGEMLRTYKDRVQRGEVRLRKEVVTDNQTIDVPVSREEIVIERTPGRGDARGGEIGTGEEIRVPLSEERVRVEKQPIVNEEVRVGKRQVQSNRQVSDEVRHEELRVDKTGDVNTETGERKPKTKKPAA